MSAIGKSGHSPCSTNFYTDSRFSQAETNLWAGHPKAMLTEIYIEALLADEKLADQVWEAWDAGEVDDQSAYIAWWHIVLAQIRT